MNTQVEAAAVAYSEDQENAERMRIQAIRDANMADHNMAQACAGAYPEPTLRCAILGTVAQIYSITSTYSTSVCCRLIPPTGMITKQSGSSRTAAGGVLAVLRVFPSSTSWMVIWIPSASPM